MKKSQLQPVKVAKWLGFIIDTSNMEFRVPNEKIEALFFLYIILRVPYCTMVLIPMNLVCSLQISRQPPLI